MTDLSEEYPEARVSRTARYRKVTKPLLERRRRARINRCLEELKDLMVGALEVERENINKLEKADILELTVRHLSKLKGPKDVKAEAERFQAGFGHCAAEAYHFILSTPGVDQNIIQQLVKHLSSQLNEKPMASVQPPIISPAPSTSSASSAHSGHSPSYPIDYQRSSPSISPRDDHSRHHQNWKEDPPSVPVERSLTCDVSSYNTQAVIRRPGEPISTGLLMTVNDARRMSRYVPDNVLVHHPRENRSDISETRERPIVDQNAERKNIILKKIREHIMERQHREPDSTTSAKKEILNNPHQVDGNRTSYSPVNAEVSHSQRHRNSTPYIGSRNSDTRTNQDVKEEAVNLTNDMKKYKAIKNHCEIFSEEKPSVSSSQDHVVGLKRQHTDYKSIHPKKVFIRTPNMSNVNERVAEYKDDVHYRNENPSYCVDGQDNYHEMNRHAGEPSRAGKGPSNENSFREGFIRYKNHYFNLEKEEYYRDPNMEQDDMWRPW